MALKGVSYPGGGSALNTIFVDDRFGSALGTSMFDVVPVLAHVSRPVDYCRDFDDFLDWNDVTPESYTLTPATTNIGTSATVPGGVLSMATAATASAQAGAQRIACWNLHATKTLYCEVRANGGHATNGGWAIGLMSANTAPFTAVVDGVFFRKDDGDANIDACTTGASSATNTDTTIDAVASANNLLGIEVTSTSAKFYVDGILRATHTTNLPLTTIDLRVIIAGIATAGGTAMTVLCDYHDTLQSRTV